MAWEWDANDILGDEDDGQEWVPATPQMLGTGMTGNVMRVTQSSMLRMLLHQIIMYLVQPSRSRQFEQERILVMMVVLTPQCSSEIIFKENMAENDSLRTKETITDESEESEISMVSTIPKPRLAKGKKKMVKIGQQGVPQKAEVTVLAEPRTQPCNRCVAKHHVCLPRVKGGQLLSACVGCFIQKLSCQMAGKSGRKIKVVKEEDVRGLGKSSKNDEGSDESGGRWMAKVQHFEGGTSHRLQTYDGLNRLDMEASGVGREGSQLKKDD